MKKYRQMKKKAKKIFISKYALFTFTCLISAYFQIEFIDSLNFVSKPNFKNIPIGNKGVLSQIIMFLSSGSLTTKILHIIKSIVGSDTIANTILIILGMVLSLVIWVMVKNTYRVISRRIFLEARIYEKVPVQRFAYLFKIKKYLKATKTMFIYAVYYLLWSLTIVGIFVKRYAYYLIPYIVAENPNISSKMAIKLSNDMMDGHKWECFKLELSFIMYEILGYITLGITKVFYSNPYKGAFFTEYYVSLREEYLNKNNNSKKYLFDEYLYNLASKKVLREGYSDIFELIKKSSSNKIELKGINGFLIRNFGISLYDDKLKEEYEKEKIRSYCIDYYIDVLNSKSYPTRLYPLTKKNKPKKIETINYTRSYSFTNIIILFFIFSFGGYLWEVFLHILNDGELINRGVLHGPWLPIYGSGSILILTLLNRYRKYPVIEFISIILLCGTVEYFTSLYLEIKYGLNWWNYQGYFLNLNGRICAEGLLVFAIGGMAVVYLLAPFIDNYLKKINKKIIYILCIILVIIFIFDKTYSSRYPNTGEGISNYNKIYERNK